jgi:hypothetical protein
MFECRPLDLADTVGRAIDALAANGRLAQDRIKVHGGPFEASRQVAALESHKALCDHAC